MAFVPTPGGVNTALDITAPAVIKAAAGNIVTIIVSGTPSAGALTLNDCTTTAAASAANQIASIPYGALTNLPLNFNWFVALNGIVISAVPTGAAVAISYS